MPDDVRTRFGFVRQDAGHQRAATVEWRESGGTINFVGEWHTHLETHPKPSWIDRRSWKKQMRTRGPDPLVFVIGGSMVSYCALGDHARLTVMAQIG